MARNIGGCFFFKLCRPNSLTVFSNFVEFMPKLMFLFFSTVVKTTVEV